MNKPLAPHVFVSYSHDDESYMQRLVANLRAQGINVWIDKSGIPPGTPDWEEALRAAISTALAVILIASPKSRSSRYVRDELRIAEDCERQIYPIWVDGTKWMDCIPIGFGGMQRFDARGSLYESALSDLAVALGNLSVTSQEAESLGQLGQASPGVLAALLAVLHNDAEAAVRNQVARSLGQLGQASPEVLAALLAALHNDANVMCATRRLGAWGNWGKGLLKC